MEDNLLSKGWCIISVVLSCTFHWILLPSVQSARGHDCPDSKVRVTNMGPTWVLAAPGGPQVGPTLAPWILLSGWFRRCLGTEHANKPLLEIDIIQFTDAFMRHQFTLRQDEWYHRYSNDISRTYFISDLAHNKSVSLWVMICYRIWHKPLFKDSWFIYLISPV